MRLSDFSSRWARFVERAVDKLHGLAQAAGRFGFPDFAIAAASQATREHVARNGFLLHRGAEEMGQCFHS